MLARTDEEAPDDQRHDTVDTTPPPEPIFRFRPETGCKSIPPKNTSKVEEIGAVHGPGKAILEIERQALFLLLYYTRA